MSLLENIERELSTIRSELGDLKRELGELRGGAAVQPAASQEAGEEPAGGFFEASEDEDETIALTGAELDNIMNTAEFTEEAGQPTEIDDFIPSAEGPVLDELMPEADQDYAPVTEISLEEPQQESEPIELDLESTESNALVGSEDEVEVLASMDIDAELADIEDLEDTTETLSEDLEREDDDVNLSEAELIEPEESEVEDLLEEVPEETPSEIEELDEIDLEEAEIEELDLSEDTASGGLELDEDILDQAASTAALAEAETDLPDNLKSELRSVLSYMDQLLESLPEEKIKEFARSEHFNVYRRLFEELGLEQ